MIPLLENQRSGTDFPEAGNNYERVPQVGR